MHDHSATGNDFFKCDFCRQGWSEERPMVEGHQGSLICASCLSTGYADVVLFGGGAELAGQKCTMCLEERDQPQWESPLFAGVRACGRCLRQSATTLEKDPDSGWKKPARRE